MEAGESRPLENPSEGDSLLQSRTGPDALPTVPEDGEADLENQPMLAIPPDGGYGWVIVAASFLANMMVDGIAYAYGILLIELVAYYEETKAKVSLVGSLLCGVYLSTGPIAAAFVQLYGCRKVTMAGSVLSCIGLGLSVLAPNVETLMVTYGVIGGFGFGLVYLPSTIVVNLYFESRRPLAVGIAVCGSGVGAFVFGPFMTALMEFYDWKNVMLILSGLMLNCAVFGALYRPLLLPSKASRKTVSSQQDIAENASVGSRGSRSRLRSGGSLTTPAGAEGETEENRVTKGPGGHEDILNYIQRNREESEMDARIHTSDNITADGKARSNSTENVVKRHRTRSDCPQKDGISETAQLIRSTPNLGAKKSAVSARPAVQMMPLPVTVNKPEEYSKPMNRMDIFYTSSVFNMNRLGMSSANIPNSNQYIGSLIMSMTRIPTEDEIEDGRKTCWQRVPKSLRDVISQMTDFSLLKKSPYLFTWIANILFMIGYYVPFFLLFDFAIIHNGVESKKASLILSAMGISNTFGRIFFGWLVGRPRVTALFVNNITILLAGILTIFVPFCTTFPLMLMYGIGYGLLVAPVISLTSEILCDMLGIDKLTNAFGLITLARGISSSAGPPFVAGFLFDSTRRFDIPYFTAGGIIILSSLLFFFLHLPAFQKQMQRNRRDMEEQVAAAIAASSSALNNQMDVEAAV